ncbi:MAG TPA: flagellar basal body P-ring formation chaperone FlgA [Gammaproteobacteria bacterium]|nr:flagellar basal body P-ring formation chaperone FlgA [Gammaproteobacteria bacterium]
MMFERAVCTAICLGVRAVARAGVVGILTLVVGSLTREAAGEPSWQTPDSIREAARELVLRTLGGDRGATVEAVGVDDRLKLPQCGAPLDAALERELRGGQGVVAVSCRVPETWRLFVPVRAVEQVPVVVTRRAVQAGEVLDADDVALEARRSATLPYEYFSATAQTVGLTARRTLAAGTVVVPAAVEHPTVVERGAVVTLVSGSGSVLVRSDGVALEPAKLNDHVRVRSRSGRIVSGVVGPSGEVRIGP